MTLRELFVARFDEELASTLEAAAEFHSSDPLALTVTIPPTGGRGSDPFRWVIVQAITFECFEKDEFRRYHQITEPAQNIKDWIKIYADLASYDGPVDFFATVIGRFDEYMWELSPDEYRHVPGGDGD